MSQAQLTLPLISYATPSPEFRGGVLISAIYTDILSTRWCCTRLYNMRIDELASKYQHEDGLTYRVLMGVTEMVRYTITNIYIHWHSISLTSGSTELFPSGNSLS